MENSVYRYWLIGVFSAGLLLAGCASTYYQVKDAQTGDIYYTKKIDRSGSGAITFIDARNGAQVTIQNSITKEVNEQEFDTGRAAQPVAKQTPVPAAAPPAAAAPAPAPAIAPPAPDQGIAPSQP